MRGGFQIICREPLFHLPSVGHKEAELRCWVSRGRTKRTQERQALRMATTFRTDRSDDRAVPTPDGLPDGFLMEFWWR